MKLGIMQPYFMPYLGYFSLIDYVDKFILFDTPQFIRHGWIERNQILKLDKGTFYIKVPLRKHSREVSIKDIEINNEIDWKRKMIAQFEHYKKKAPYYNEVMELLNGIFNESYHNIVDINHASLKSICNYIEIDTPIEIWSEMKVEIQDANAPDEWALNICKALNADVYVNPPGGKSFFNKDKYDKSGVELCFLEFMPTPYEQVQKEFIPYMSVLDALLFCSPKQVRDMISNILIS